VHDNSNTIFANERIRIYTSQKNTLYYVTLPNSNCKADEALRIVIAIDDKREKKKPLAFHTNNLFC
jgi:hypothetical protein